MWTEGGEKEESVGMVCLAFKEFLAHAHKGKNVPTSDADDGWRYALRTSLVKTVWTERGEEKECAGMAGLAFKGFQAHAHKGKDVTTSDTDDRGRYALHLPSGGLCFRR